MRLQTPIVIHPDGKSYNAPAHVDGSRVTIRMPDQKRSGVDAGSTVEIAGERLQVTAIKPQKGVCALEVEPAPSLPDRTRSSADDEQDDE